MGEGKGQGRGAAERSGAAAWCLICVWPRPACTERARCRPRHLHWLAQIQMAWMGWTVARNGQKSSSRKQQQQEATAESSSRKQQQKAAAAAGCGGSVCGHKATMVAYSSNTQITLPPPSLSLPAFPPSFLPPSHFSPSSPLLSSLLGRGFLAFAHAHALAQAQIQA